MTITTYFGDLHANTLKMLIGLKDEGIITNLRTHYEELKKAYDLNNVKDFISLINKLEFNTAVIEKRSLCYLGDILADRGQNDVMTLHLMNKMTENNVDYEIIYSNHDHYFIRNIPHMNSGHYNQIKSDLMPGQDQSLMQFKESLEKKDISTNQMKDMINNYLSKLKLISLKYDSKENNPIIATHAPLNKMIVDNIQQKTQVYNTLSDKVTDINSDFNQFITQLSKKKNLEYEKVVKQVSNQRLEPDQHLGAQLTWNRVSGNDDFLQVLNTKANSKLYHIHGHDSGGKQLYPNSFNLDNYTGKGRSLTYKTNLDSERLIINTKNVMSNENEKYNYLSIEYSLNSKVNKDLQKAVIALYIIDVNLTTKTLDNLKNNQDLQKAIIALNNIGVDLTTETWNNLKNNQDLQKAIIALDNIGVDLTTETWDNLKNNQDLQKAIIVAHESGFKIKTNTFNFLKKNPSLCQTLASNYDAIQKIDTKRNDGELFKNKCQTLQHQLVEDVIGKAFKTQQKGKKFNFRNEYSYQQLQEQTEMLTVVNDNQKTPKQKIETLDKYESNAKKKSSGWAKFGKAIASVLITGVCAVLGAAVGIGIGIAAGGSAGSIVPGLGTVGGAIVGAAIAGWKGATIGAGVGAVASVAASTIFFNRDSKEEKMAKDVIQKGRNFINLEN